MSSGNHRSNQETSTDGTSAELRKQIKALEAENKRLREADMKIVKDHIDAALRDFTPGPPEPLPVIRECNRCGECCLKGENHPRGCELRRLHPLVSATWEGRCEFLVDCDDGTTLCQRMVDYKCEPVWMKLWGIDGMCDFPDLYREIEV